MSRLRTRKTKDRFSALQLHIHKVVNADVGREAVDASVLGRLEVLATDLIVGAAAVPSDAGSGKGLCASRSADQARSSRWTAPKGKQKTAKH